MQFLQALFANYLSNEDFVVQMNLSNREFKLLAVPSAAEFKLLVDCGQVFYRPFLSQHKEPHPLMFMKTARSLGHNTDAETMPLHIFLVALKAMGPASHYAQVAWIS